MSHMTLEYSANLRAAAASASCARKLAQFMTGLIVEGQPVFPPARRAGARHSLRRVLHCRRQHRRMPVSCTPFSRSARGAASAAKAGDLHGAVRHHEGAFRGAIRASGPWPYRSNSSSSAKAARSSTITCTHDSRNLASTTSPCCPQKPSARLPNDCTTPARAARNCGTFPRNIPA